MFYKFLLNLYWEDLVHEKDLFEYIGLCSRSGEILIHSDQLKSSKNKSLTQHKRISTFEIESLSESYKNRRKKKLTLQSNNEQQQQQQQKELIEKNYSSMMKTIIPSKIIDPLNQSQLQSTSQSLKDSLKKKLDSSINWLSTSSYIYLLLSILVNIPWILLILFIQTNIKYNSNTDLYN